MVSPDQEAKECDCERGECNEVVTEHSFSRKCGDNFGDNTKARQNHDVNRRVAIEPEHVLEKNWVSSKLWAEDWKLERSLEDNAEKRDRNDWSSEHHDDASCILGPNEEWEPEPGHTRRTHPMDSRNKVNTCCNGTETSEEDAHQT